jgi:arylsulfatase A-like enzyme|eukprot:COSAG02_NODE_1396_length_12898_cov_23.802953_13_plen_223_part_00
MFQKENYFEEACRIPFLVSWPVHPVLGKLCGTVENRLVGQADIFGLVTAAAGSEELRDGVSILTMLSRPDANDDGSGAEREYFFGVYSEPGSQQFKIMVRSHTHKYVFMANGGRELLFDLVQDPFEMTTLCALTAEENSTKYTAERGGSLQLLPILRAAGVAFLQASSAGIPALDPSSHSGFLEHEFVARPYHRIMQMAADLGVTGFPDHPGDVLERWPPRL